MSHPYVWAEVRRGAERHLEDLVGYLRARGHDVRVLTTANGTRLPPRADRAPYVVRGRTASGWLTARGFDPLAAFVPTMVPPLLREPARVVHALSPADGAAAVLTRRRGRAVVTTLMGIPFRWWNERTGAGSLMWRTVLGRADAVVCLSTFAARVLEADYGRAAHVIPLGVDAGRFRPVAERAAEPTILFAAALDEPRKRLDLLLRAFAEIAPDHAGLRVVARGNGDPAAALAARDSLPAALRGRVELRGAADGDLAADYSAAWVTALPSRNEALGLVLAESLACGTPVVGTADGGITDVIDDPAIGRTFAPDDAGELARALTEGLALSQEDGIRERCLASAARFDMATAVGPAIERVYQGVA